MGTKKPKCSSRMTCLCQGRHLWDFCSFIWQNCYEIERKALSAYPFPAVLCDFILHWCSWLLNNIHTMVCFLSVGNRDSMERFVGDDVPLIHQLSSGSSREVESFFTLTWKASGRFQKIICFIRCKDTAGAVEPLHNQGHLYYMKPWPNIYCFLFVVSCCCDKLDAKHISCIRHGTSVQKPWVRCLFSLNDIRDLKTGQLRTVMKTNEGQNLVKPCKHCTKA